MDRLSKSKTCGRHTPAARRAFVHTRMPSLAIYGDSGMGKTMIMHRFRMENPPVFTAAAGIEQTPVLALQMTGKHSERRFFAQLLAAAGAHGHLAETSSNLNKQLFACCGRSASKSSSSTRRNLAGPQREQRIILNTLRFLSNELSFSLVCLGVGDAREAISGDVQLARRIDEMQLHRWAANEEIETLIASILRNLPLAQPDFPERTRAASNPANDRWRLSASIPHAERPGGRCDRDWRRRNHE